MYTYLEKRDPRRNQARFYRMSVMPNLFGEWTASAQGVGSISGRKVNLPFTTYLGVTGHFEGELSEDGRSISGKAKYHANGMEAMLYITKE